MNPLIVRLVMLALAVLGSQSPVVPRSRAPMSREQVLDRWAEALGGRQTLQGIRTVHLAGAIETGGLKGTYQRWSTSRGEYRMAVDITGAFRQERIFDGQRGWVLDMSGAVHEMSGGDLQSVITSAYEASHSLLLPDRMKGDVELLGEDEGREAYVLRLLPDGGQPLTVYLDRTTFLPQTEETTSTAGRRIVSFADWRDHAGMRVPMIVRQSGSDPKLDLTITTSLVELDVPLGAATFSEPAQSAPAVQFTASGHQVILGAVFAQHMFIPVRINGSEPAWFFVDSGAAVSVISRSLADKIGLPVNGRIGGQGTGSGTAGMEVASNVVLDLSGLRVPTNTIAVWDFSHLLPKMGRQWDGILGYDVLSRLVVRMDYEHQQVAIFDPTTFVPDADSAILPITFIGNMPLVHGRISVEGRDPIDIKCAIDSGASGFHLTAPFIRRNQITQLVAGMLSTSTSGAGGDSKEYVGRIPGLQLGPWLLHQPVTEFAVDERSGLLASEEIDALVGGEVLDRFTVTFDFPHSQVLLKPNLDFSHPFAADASGLSLLATGTDFHRFEIVGVEQGSSAAAAGLQPGDILTIINGLPASELDLDKLGTLFEQAGRIVSLGIVRGDKSLVVTLHLKTRF